MWLESELLFNTTCSGLSRFSPSLPCRLAAQRGCNSSRKITQKSSRQELFVTDKQRLFCNPACFEIPCLAKYLFHLTLPKKTSTESCQIQLGVLTKGH